MMVTLFYNAIVVWILSKLLGQQGFGGLIWLAGLFFWFDENFWFGIGFIGLSAAFDMLIGLAIGLIALIASWFTDDN
jgi:hypothetical protein